MYTMENFKDDEKVLYMYILNNNDNYYDDNSDLNIILV